MIKDDLVLDWALYGVNAKIKLYARIDWSISMDVRKSRPDRFTTTVRPALVKALFWKLF